jgi:SSS family solute:Na+ symporter
VCAFFASTILALYTKNIVDFVRKFLPLTMSGLGVIILLGRFWKRANWQGALAALITTPLVALAVMYIPAQAKFWGDPTIPAVAAGLLAQIIVSLLTAPARLAFAEVAEAMDRERSAIESGSSAAAAQKISATPTTDPRLV